MPDYYYRYEDPEDAHSLIYLGCYEIIKRTPKGVWISYWSSSKGKFILNSAHKQWACATIEEAKVSYIKRKERQIKILSAQLNRATESLAVAKADNFQEKPYFFAAEPKES